MLCITRKKGQTVKVDGPCEIVIIKTSSGAIKLGFKADRSTIILRGELEPHERRTDKRTGLAVSPAE